MNKKGIAVSIIASLLIFACSLPTPGMHTHSSPSPILTDFTATSTSVTDVCKVTVGNLNLRRGPGTNSAVDAVLNSGDVLTIDQETFAQGNWQRVFYGDLTGWVNMNYCK